MRKALAVVFFAGLFLLMLSTLVVSPDDASSVNVPPPSPADFQAVVLPPSMPQPVCSADHFSTSEERCANDCVQLSFDPAVSTAAIHDSNGRVLTSVRYENSVYQVFRAGVAGG